MVPFSVDLAVAFRRGSARGERSHLFSMGIKRDQFMQEIGSSINASIAAHREAFEDRRRKAARPDNPENHPAFRISRDQSDPKSRWVNGTPEYSFGIGGLRKLFPAAHFIHLVRHPDLVVPSMLNFDRVSGVRLAETEEGGYERWQAYVTACLMAENAYGALKVCRIFHEDMVREPDSSLGRILDFIGEPFDPVCLEPLVKRINSSKVQAAELVRERTADSPARSEAHALWKTLRENPPRSEPQPHAAALMEEQFEERVEYVHDLDARCARARQAHLKLQKEFEDRTQWGMRLHKEVEEKGKRILQLQCEVAERTQWAMRLHKEFEEKDKRILQLQDELADRTKWAHDLSEEVARHDEVIFQLQKEFAERTKWALDLQAECDRKDALILELQKQPPPQESEEPSPDV